MFEEWRYLDDCSLYKKKHENKRFYEFLTGLNRELDDIRGIILGQPQRQLVKYLWRLVMMKETTRPSEGIPALNTSNGPLKHYKSIRPRTNF